MLVTLALVLGIVIAAHAEPAAYDNKQFGVRVAIPAGWTVASETERQAYVAEPAAQSTPQQLLLVMSSTGGASNESIVLMAEQSPPDANIAITAEQYLDAWAASHPSLERLRDRKKKWASSYPSQVGWFKTNTDPPQWIELVIARHRNTFLLLRGTFDAEQAMIEAERALFAFLIAPDWVSPTEKPAEEDSLEPQPITDVPVVQVERHVTPGLLIKKVQPSYPKKARRAHVEGSVVLLGNIHQNGKIMKLWILSGPPLLVDSALDAVHQWEYRPYVLDGKPVEVETQVTVNFSLR
jgi:TonB family protein